MQLLIIAKKLVNKKPAEKYSICRLTKEFVHGKFVKDSKLLSHVFHQVLEGSVKGGADWKDVIHFGSFSCDKGPLDAQKKVAADLLLSCLMASDKKTLKALEQGYLSRLLYVTSINISEYSEILFGYQYQRAQSRDIIWILVNPRI